MEYVTNKYIFKDNFILSFEPISVENFTAYNYKPPLRGDHLVRKNVIVFNDELEPVFEFNSARPRSGGKTIQNRFEISSNSYS
jgi:hypothetical protein